MAKENEKYYIQTIIENYHVVAGEPGKFYLSYVTPPDGTGKSIAEKKFAIITDTPLEEKLKVFG